MKETETKAPSIGKKDIFYIIIIVLMLIGGTIFYTNSIRNEKAKYENYEKTIAALNDTMKVAIKNGIAEYSKKTPEIMLNDLMKSEYFKTLSEDQKKYYTELSKIKGLISSSKAELQLVGQQLAELKNKVGEVETDSLGTKVCYRATDTLDFAQVDTSKKFKWDAKLSFDKNLKPGLSMNYDYKFDIQTDFVRNKDKSIVVNWKINDPDLKVNDMHNFIIPTEQPKNKFGRWLEKNKRPLQFIAGSALFVGGGYVGYKLAK
jgi:hypothetical protein